MNIKIITMKKTIQQFIMAALCLSTLNMLGQNSILQNPTTKNLSTIQIKNFSFVSNLNDLVMVIAPTQGDKLYCIDMNHLNNTGVTDLLVQSIPNVSTNIAATMGLTNITIQDMENNSKSGSTFILAGQWGNYDLFEVRSSTSILPVDLTNVQCVEIPYNNGGCDIKDISFGDNTLYVSSSGLGNVNGEITKISLPFSSNSVLTTQKTSLNNWGMFTNAPMERFTYGKIGSSKRLIGGMTCAPGYSISVNDITGSANLDVNTQYDFFGATPSMLFSVSKGNTSYVFVHLDDWGALETYRLGEAFVDGVTPAANNEINANAKTLRPGGAAIDPAIATDDAKHLGSADAICYYNQDYYAQVTNAGELKVIQINWPSTVGVSETSDNIISFYPNPSSDFITIDAKTSEEFNFVTIYSLDGKVVLNNTLNNSNEKIDISKLKEGTYLFVLTDNDGNTYTRKLKKN